MGYVTLPGVYCISKNPLHCCQSRWLATSKRWLSRWYTRIVSFRGIGGSRVYQENFVYHIKTRWWFQIIQRIHQRNKTPSKIKLCTPNPNLLQGTPAFSCKPQIPASTRGTTRGTSSSMIQVTEGFFVQLSRCRCCRRCRFCVFGFFKFLITLCNPM